MDKEKVIGNIEEEHTSNDESKIVSPILGTRYAHACHEVDRRKWADNNNI